MLKDRNWREATYVPLRSLRIERDIRLCSCHEKRIWFRSVLNWWSVLNTIQTLLMTEKVLLLLFVSMYLLLSYIPCHVLSKHFKWLPSNRSIHHTIVTTLFRAWTTILSVNTLSRHESDLFIMALLEHFTFTPFLVTSLLFFDLLLYISGVHYIFMSTICFSSDTI